MSLASIGVRTTVATITTASVQLLATAAVKFRLLECSYVQTVGTAQSVGLGRPAANGVTPGTTSTFQRDDSADPACVTTASLSFGTSPTAPTVYHRRWNSAATIGVGIVWTFPRGLIVPVSGALVIFQITAGQLSDANFAIDE